MYGSVASVTNGMDTKTFVEQSEAFAKLAITHKLAINLNSVATHFVQMTKDVSSLLHVIKVYIKHIINISVIYSFLLVCINYKDQQGKKAERSAMVARRLLKILEKITAAYGKNFTEKAMPVLIELLAQLHG